MTKLTTKVKKGDIVLVTSGAYSDFGIIALGRATQDFDALELAPEFHSNKRERIGDICGFGDWLIDTGRIKKVAFKELYIGDYTVEPSVFDNGVKDGE